MAERQTQAVRRERTRGALIAAARELFAEKGFADTANDDISDRAGVTRGALYHYFDSKSAVATAVIESLDAEIVERIRAVVASTDDPAEQLRRSCRAYIDACAEPAFARLVVEAPVILGPDAMRALDDRSAIRLLSGAIEHGLALPGDARVAPHLLMGMLNEAAQIVARDPRSRRRVQATVDEFVERLLTAS
jgi:AcrR family transcriptional regulator